MKSYFFSPILLMIGLLAFFAARNYEGKYFIYLIFTISFNVLLILGFSKRKTFFDLFIGIFFWLGFWLKFSVRIAFMEGHFQEPVGLFDWSAGAYDRALLVSSCGALALILARYVRSFLFSYDRGIKTTYRMEALYDFYYRYRWTVLILFCSIFIFVAFTNIAYGIYQRGTPPSTILPLGLNGIYTWLLLFGLASFSAVILNCELQRKKDPYTAGIIALSECFFSNSTMLSRGMILNGSSLLFGLHKQEQWRALRSSKMFKGIMILSFTVLFGLSVFAVNQIRMFRHAAPALNETIPSGQSRNTKIIAPRDHAVPEKKIKDTASKPLKAEKTSQKGKPERDAQKISFNPKPQDVDVKTMMNWQVFYRTAGLNLKSMLIDRWVGIEGAMAVSSYPYLGWNLWNRAWREKFSHAGTSLYDSDILSSPYLKLDLSEFHFINLPGILAFLYYPGSYLFLFAGMFAAGIFGAAMEWFVYRYGGGNMILCSLMAQVLAYRYVHFGYAPQQTYMLIGTMILNVLIIYTIIKVTPRFGDQAVIKR